MGDGDARRDRTRGKLLAIAVEVEDVPDGATRQLMDQGLDEYNDSKAGGDNSQDLWVIARDSAGTVQGGVKAKTFYSWMFIDWLWVSKSAQGVGIGSLLMEKAEAVARERGCIGAYVDTFSFHAPDFYRSSGYEEFGRIEELPPGHACIWLRRHLLGSRLRKRQTRPRILEIYPPSFWFSSHLLCHDPHQMRPKRNMAASEAPNPQ